MSLIDKLFEASKQASSATLKPDTNQGNNPVADFYNKFIAPATNAVSNYIMGPAKTPAPYDVINPDDPTGGGYETPGGAMIRGNWSDVIPAINRRATFFAKHPENIQFAGDMAEVPSAPAEVNTWSQYIRNEKTGNMIKNPNYKSGAGNPTQYSQKGPEYPNSTTTEEQANFKNTPLTEEKTMPKNPANPSQQPLTGKQKVIQKLNGIDNYQLPSSYTDRIGKENIDKSIIQNDIGGNTFDQVLERLPAAKQKVWNEAINIAKSDPRPIDFNTQVRPYLEKEMQKLVSDGVIGQDMADQAITEYAIRLKDAANQGLYKIDSTTPLTAPIDFNQPISMEQLFNAKTTANGMSASAWDSAGNIKNNLNSVQRVNLALADGMDNAVTSLNPSLKEATQKYSSMSRIEPNITTSLRNQNLQVAKLPIINQGIPFSGAARRLSAAAINGDPKAMATLGVLGAGAVGAGAYISDKTGLTKAGMNSMADTFGYAPKTSAQKPENQEQGQDSHTSSITQGVNTDGYFTSDNIPQNVGDVKLEVDGSVNVANPTQIKDSTGNVIAIDPNEANKQIRQLKDANSKLNPIAAQTIEHPLEAQKAQGQIDANNSQLESLKNLSESSGPLNKAYEHVKLVTGKTNTTLKTLNSVSPNLGNLSSQIDDLQNSLDPAYAGLKQQLIGIQKEIQGGNLNVKTKDALVNVLKTINQQNSFDYYQAIQSFVGAPAVDTKNMAPTASGVPQFPAQSKTNISSTPPDFSAITGGSAPVLQFPQQ